MSGVLPTSYTVTMHNSPANSPVDGQPVEPITYTVRVYVATTWATGELRGTTTRTFQIVEEPSIMGAVRAIDAAVDRCNGHDLCEIHSPEIDPNPAALGWSLTIGGAK